LIGCLLWLPLSSLPQTLQGVIILLLIGLGVWASGHAETLLDEKDASAIVIDEIVGMFLTYFSLRMTLTSLPIGFVFFRLFDILKPIPALERIPGGWGVMLDDLCAGIMANLCTRIALYLL
jgi:phosphatidylglycerophosphatase A